MFETFQYHVMSAWELWSGLFAPLPYGDPVIAMAVLILIFVFGTKWFLACNVSGV